MTAVYNNLGVLQDNYYYDGDGRRARRVINGVETWQVYGIGGELVGEYVYNQVTPPSVSAPQKEYGYRNGKMLVVWDGTQSGNQVLKWLVTDQLGSTRMEADLSGSLTGMKRHDYLPFGEELTASVGAQRSGIGYEPPASNVKQKFTDKERDVETGLDFFGARYCASTQGRFTGADPISLGVDRLFDPQRFNRYAYVRNNPLIFTDPDGRDIVLGGGDQKKAKQALVEIAKRPGGRELLTKMDKLTLTIAITSGEVVRQGPDAYGNTKGSFVLTKDSQGNLDAKNGPSGNGVVITLDFKLADEKRKENKTIAENNKGMEEIGLPGKHPNPDVPKSDAELSE